MANAESHRRATGTVRSFQGGGLSTGVANSAFAMAFAATMGRDGLHVAPFLPKRRTSSLKEALPRRGVEQGPPPGDVQAATSWARRRYGRSPTMDPVYTTGSLCHVSFELASLAVFGTALITVSSLRFHKRLG